MNHRISEHAEVLGAALAVWDTRDDARPQPGARRAASAAMTEIDAMLATLHAVRSSLVTEIRASDAASAARVDAMVADRHGWASGSMR